MERDRGKVYTGLNCLKILFLNLRNYYMDIHYKISMPEIFHNDLLPASLSPSLYPCIFLLPSFLPSSPSSPSFHLFMYVYVCMAHHLSTYLSSSACCLPISTGSTKWIIDLSIRLFSLLNILNIKF